LTAQGHPRAIFKRAIENGNVVIAEMAAREVGRLTLAEALALTALVVQRGCRGRRDPVPEMREGDRRGVPEAGSRPLNGLGNATQAGAPPRQRRTSLSKVQSLKISESLS
jgi:hypothetical protein